VTQFSTVIGAYLFAMGIGSWLTRYIDRNLAAWFLRIEILVGLAGGFSSAALFLAFGGLGGIRIVLYAVVGVVGVLVGLEIPLLLRILKDQLQFKDLVSRVLALDYLGALAASLAFPLWLVPQVGLLRGAMTFGMANVAVALGGSWLFPGVPVRRLRAEALAALALLAAGMAYADRILDAADDVAYQDEVVYAKTSAYQRIVLTRRRDDVRLYLNGHLQFSSRDEYRYHEALVHPGLAAAPRPERALVLGGGDGLAVREILRDDRVREVVLVDLDPEVTRLFRDHEMPAALNGGSLRSPRVRIVNEDAFVWLERGGDLFDFIAADFPDPSTHALGKLFSTAFYRRAARRLAPDGVLAVQATSPLFARRAFWCIVETIRGAGLRAAPYHAYVPSFGEWGFVVASRRPYRPPDAYPPGLRFIAPSTAATLFEFPADMARVDAEVNRLNNQILVHYYESEWRAIGE
jgi:spermidine synthase